MWIRNLKCSLVVVLFACAFLAGSGSVSASTHDEASASAISSTGVFKDAENIPGAHDRHKGIRSYDSTGFPHDSNINRGVKPYGTPSEHGASHDHGTKGGGHDYNKNGDGCSKCKWENDDYWERDEPEEEGDENDGDECDDGQYRPDKAHHHGPSRGHKPGSHPSGVHKTGPTGVYVDDGSSNPSGPLGGTNYPTGIGYTRPISGYESTPKPGSGWYTPFADASKPGYGSVTASTFGTTPSSLPDWNQRTTPGGSGFPSKPVWGGRHDGRLPSSQGSGAPVPNFGATTKSGQPWNINQFPSSSSSAVPHTGSGISSPSNYGNPQENQNRPYGQPGTQNAYTGAYAGAYAGASVASGVGSPYGEASNVGRKDHPFGPNKPVNTQVPQRPYSGIDQTPSNTDNDYYGLGGSNKPRPGSYSTPTTVTNTFGTTKGPHGGLGSPITVPGVQNNPFAPGKSPGSPTGSGTYDHPGVTKPSYGGSTSWLGAGQTGSQSSTWHNTGTTPYAGFPTSNTGFGTTKTPFSHVSTPSSTLTVPYDRTGSRQPNFNVASSSATASAGASAFGTSPGTYSTPSITGTTSLYGTTPTHRGSPSYTPGIKGSIGGTRPAYGTHPVPHGTHPNIESGTWPKGQLGSNTGPWPSRKPEDGSRITPGGYSPGVNGILPGKQPQGGGTWPTRQPASESETWPSKQPGDGSATWPGQVQPGHGSGPGCRPGGNCEGATGPQEGSNCGGCCGNYNCNNDCSGRGNVPTHGLCGSAISPSGVNKTYYPAGTGDGSVPNIGTAYGQNSPLNTRTDIRPAYPGTQGAHVTQENSVPWNSANPFLYGTGGSTPSSASQSWTETTSKPIGQGNPFLDSNWNRPKPGFSNVDNGRNMIPHGEENTKPIGQGNLFLDDNNRRGDTGANPNEGVIPLEGKIPKGSNPFLTPLGESSGSGGPAYGKHPDRPGTSGNIPGTPGSVPGSRIPGNYPGSGTPGSFPGSITPGNYPGLGIPGNYPSSGTPENYPSSGTPGNYPGSRIPANYPSSGTPGNYPGSGTPGSFPGSVTPGNYPGSGTPGNYPSSGTPGNYPGSETPGSFPGSVTPGNYPGSGTPGNYPSSGTPGNYPGSRTPGNYPGSGTPGSFPGSVTPGNYPGSGTPGNYPSSGTPGNYPGSGTPGNYPSSGTPGNYPSSGTPGNYPGAGTPGNYPGAGTPGSFPGSETPGSFPGSGAPGSGGYEGVKGGFHPSGTSPQNGNNDKSYPQSGGNPQSPGPLQCKLGLFGCGTSGSGSYAGDNLGGAPGGNVGTGTRNSGGLGNIPGVPGNLGIGSVPSNFAAGVGPPGSGGNNLAASIGGGQARAYAGSFSSAQASSSSFAGSFSGASGPANNFGGNLSPSGAQNQGGPNSWASSGASAFASSNAGSWSGNRPIDVKG